MKAKALFSILSKKMTDGEIIFVDNITLEKPKTKEAKGILTSLAGVKGFEGLKKRKNSAYIALEGRSESVEKSFKNFGNLEVGEARNLSPIMVLKYKYLIVENPEKTIETLSSKVNRGAKTE